MDWKDLIVHRFPDVDYEKEIATIEIPEWLRRLGVGVKKELEWNAKRYFMVGLLFLPIMLFLPMTTYCALSAHSSLQ